MIFVFNFSPSLTLHQAHVIQRPIIVLATTTSCALEGIYLPQILEDTTGQPPGAVVPELKQPVVLGLDVAQAYFAPMMVCVPEASHRDPAWLVDRMPLGKPNGQELTIHFLASAEVCVEYG